MTRKGSRKQAGSNNTSPPAEDQGIARFHITFGWFSLAVFVTLGVVLEAMHGFKIGWYLDVDNETRRHMWRLAHAHGGLLSIVQISFGLTSLNMTTRSQRLRKISSRCFNAASVLVPVGFFLGGIWIYEGDPGIGIFLVPPGALLLIIAILLTAWTTRSKISESD